MTDTAHRPTPGARLRRAVVVLLAGLVVLGPIPVGLVWAWTVHPLLVVPAYLLGISAWLTLLSGAWALVQRVRGALPSHAEGTGPGGTSVHEPVVREPADLPALRSQVRMPSPRTEATAPQRVS